MRASRSNPVGHRGVEAEFFLLCAELSPRSWSRGHHTVYAIELDRAVWKNRAFRERNPGGAAGGCLYSWRDRAHARSSLPATPRGGADPVPLHPQPSPEAAARSGGRVSLLPYRITA